MKDATKLSLKLQKIAPDIPNLNVVIKSDTILQFLLSLSPEIPTTTKSAIEILSTVIIPSIPK